MGHDRRLRALAFRRADVGSRRLRLRWFVVKIAPICPPRRARLARGPPRRAAGAVSPIRGATCCSTRQPRGVPGLGEPVGVAGEGVEDSRVAVDAVEDLPVALRRALREQRCSVPSHTRYGPRPGRRPVAAHGGVVVYRVAPVSWSRRGSTRATDVSTGGRLNGCEPPTCGLVAPAVVPRVFGDVRREGCEAHTCSTAPTTGRRSRIGCRGAAMQHAWEERVGRREVSDLLGGVGDALRIVLPAYAAVAPAAYATP
jgi:hypothetical protein